MIIDEGRTGRVLVMNLSRDDLLLESITEELREYGIKNAYVESGIGSLQRVHIHRVIGKGPEPCDEFVEFDTPMELASLQGLILNGEPHLHTVVSDVNQTYTGHLENNTQVLYLAEIVIVELLDISSIREKDENNIGKIRRKI